MQASILASYVFEIATVIFGGVLIYHAWFESERLKRSDSGLQPGEKLINDDPLNRGRWLSTLLWGMAFGFLIEFVLSAANGYRYGGKFTLYLSSPLVAMLSGPGAKDCDHIDPIGAGSIPIWVGVGWGLVLYASTWTAQRLKQPPFAGALLAGLLAVDIDFSLDPVVRIFNGWCSHLEYPGYYQVPYDNFVGWFIIVAAYAYLVRRLFRWLGAKPGATAWIPPVAVVLSTGLVWLTDQGLELSYKPLKPLGGDKIVFFAVVALAVLGLIIKGKGSLGNLVPSWPILAVPITYHGLCWLTLLVSGAYREDGRIWLVTFAIPLALLGGFSAYAWGSRDRFLRWYTVGPNTATPGK